MSEKIKYGIYLLPETVDTVDKLYTEEGCKSRSEFVEKAIRFYCGFVTADNYKDYFPDVILTTMKGSLNCFENRMASLMFKTAVELSMLLHVVAFASDLDESDLDRLRGMCVDDVKSLHGHITFDDALRYQKS